MSEMDTIDKCFAVMTVAIFISLVLSITGMFIFNSIEAKQKERELTIRERELELKAEQYPYKNEMKLEVKR